MTADDIDPRQMALALFDKGLEPEDVIDVLESVGVAETIERLRHWFEEWYSDDDDDAEPDYDPEPEQPIDYNMPDWPAR